MKKLITLLLFVSTLPCHALIDEKVDQVALYSMVKKKAEKRKWDWEDAVFLYGLSEFGKNHHRPEMKKRIYTYLKSYHAHWLKKGLPAINRSDACPSALTALTLATDWGDSTYLSNIDPVIYYLKNEPRNTLGTINHLGHSWLRIFYPPSIWVDSMMMIGVLSSKIGQFKNDPHFMEFAARQPTIFASKLQDAEDHLFRHAWYEPSDRVVPASKSYWLRGNGWAMVSILSILENMDPLHPNYQETLRSFRNLAEALMTYQRKSGLWGTVLNYPKAYDETSGTALVGYALARAYHLGILEKSALESAQSAYDGIMKKIKKTRKGNSLRGISSDTVPGPRILYLMVPKIPDKGYGVGPFLMLAAELEKNGVNHD